MYEILEFSEDCLCHYNSLVDLLKKTMRLDEKFRNSCATTVPKFVVLYSLKGNKSTEGPWDGQKFVFQQSVIFYLCVFIYFIYLSFMYLKRNPVESFPPSCKQAVYLLSILNYSVSSFTWKLICILCILCLDSIA